MLKAMRSRAGKVVIQILAFFLIMSFAVWGVGDIFRGRTAPTDVAEVGGMVISGQELNNEFRRTVEALRRRLGPQFDTNQARQLGMLEQTLDTLVVNRLIALEADALGLDAGDDLVRSTIAADPAFHNPTRRFDPSLFREVLSRRNMSEAGYVASLRGQIIRNQLAGSLTSGHTVPRKLTDLVFEYRNERRVAEVIRIPHESTAQAGEPSGVQLTEFHRKNPAQFTAPEYRDLTVVYFDPAVMAEGITPSEKRLREEYEYRLPNLSVPERRELQQILVHDQALAERVHKALREGGEFRQVATDTAKVSTAGLALGRLTRNELPKEISDAAFALDKGGFSTPVKTALGWHILRVVNITGGNAPAFEEVRKTIARDVTREQAVDALIGIANKFEDSLAGGAKLEEAAAAVAATVLQISTIDAGGKDPAGATVKNAPGDPNFLQTAFATARRATSILTETSDGGFFMVRINQVTAPVLRPLDTVRAEVVSAWKRVQREAATKKRAEALLAAAKTSGSLVPSGTAENDKGLKLVTSKPFTRFGQDPAAAVPPSLIRSLFQAKKGGLAMAAYDKGYAVARLTEIQRARPSDDADGYKTIAKSLKTAMANDILGQFINALRERYTVSIDQRAVEALF